MKSENKSENKAASGGCCVSTCCASSLPDSLADWSSRQIKLLRDICERYRKFYYEDVIEVIGKGKVDDLIAAGFVAVKWEEHADMFRAKYPDFDQDLDPENEMKSSSIVFCHMILGWLDKKAANPTLNALCSGSELPRELTGVIHTGLEDRNPQSSECSQIGNIDS